MKSLSERAKRLRQKKHGISGRVEMSMDEAIPLEGFIIQDLQRDFDKFVKKAKKTLTHKITHKQLMLLQRDVTDFSRWLTDLRKKATGRKPTSRKRPQKKVVKDAVKKGQDSTSGDVTPPPKDPAEVEPWIEKIKSLNNRSSFVTVRKGGSTYIDGQWGRLEIQSDGYYSYELTQDAKVGGSDRFEYQLTDGVGTATSVLSIDITG